MLTIISFAFVFCIVASIHELGHFIVARRAGVRCDVFAIGFGPTIASYKIRETVYKINLIPVLAYVKLAGMEAEDIDTPDGVAKKPMSTRFFIFLAGSLLNFLLAVLIFCISGAIIGIPTERMSNVVWRVLPNSEGERIGLLIGDRIIAINDKRIKNGNEMIGIIHKSAKKRLHLKIERKGVVIYKYAVPELKEIEIEGKKKRVGLIGFNPKPIMKKVGIIESISFGLIKTYEITIVIIKVLPRIIIKLFTGKVPEEVGGPVAIAKISGQAASFGFGNLIMVLALISINVSIINLLPFPALDGGHLTLLLIEGIRGKRLDPHKENFLHIVGIALLMFLMAVLIYTDLTRGIK